MHQYSLHFQSLSPSSIGDMKESIYSHPAFLTIGLYICPGLIVQSKDKKVYQSLRLLEENIQSSNQSILILKAFHKEPEITYYYSQRINKQFIKVLNEVEVPFLLELLFKEDESCAVDESSCNYREEYRELHIVFKKYTLIRKIWIPFPTDDIQEVVGKEDNVEDSPNERCKK